MKGVQILMMGNKNKNYGYLYNYAAYSNANFAPNDWKIPDSDDLSTLISYLGGLSVAGGKLKSTGYLNWEYPNTGASNSSGFNAIGAGYVTSTEVDSTLIDHKIYSRIAFNTTILNLQSNFEQGSYGLFSEYDNYSIRLIYTGSGNPDTVTDYEGNIYKTVLIGTQRWITRNWRCSKLNNGTSISFVNWQDCWMSNTASICVYDNNINYL